MSTKSFGGSKSTRKAKFSLICILANDIEDFYASATVGSVL